MAPPYNRPVDGGAQGRRLRSFVLGGLVGASAVLAAARRRRGAEPRPARAGLAAFETAPCYAEIVEQERVAAEETRDQR
jgi:hypothetical protein